ncbi:MAG: hypothetical protein ABEI06_05345 [Halobacteriaceae archaeon]
MTAIATYQYITFEQSVTHEVEEIMEREAYADLTLVRIRIEHHLGSFNQDPRITIIVAGDQTNHYPSLPTVFHKEITERVKGEVKIRVRIIKYRTPRMRSNSNNNFKRLILRQKTLTR